MTPACWRAPRDAAAGLYVLLAGHLDTVPAQENKQGELLGGHVRGSGHAT